MTAAPRRVAVVGSGIAGLGAAAQLATQLAVQPASQSASQSAAPTQVVLFEADSHFGGHAHTVDLALPGPTGSTISHGVDTGFLVFNHATYPQLLKLFADLAVPTAASEMSFSVQVPQIGLEWSGCNLDTVFAQRSNLFKPRFLGMLRDLMRFNRITTQMAEQAEGGTEDAAQQQPQQSIGDFLLQQRFSNAFRDWYLLPMLGCIWSCPTDQMLRFPVATMVRFCHNHGLIRVTNRPQWYTVQGGSRAYVRRLLQRIPDARLNTAVTSVRRVPPGSGSAGVWVDTAHGSSLFDAVVLASHSDQSLALLGDQATADERAVLGAIRYHRNRAVLHTDSALLPHRRKAWAAWNYERSAAAAQEQSAVCLHYLLNRLQPLPWAQPVVVSLNPTREPAAATVHGEFDYAHPVFDAAAIAAQARLPSIQGQFNIWFAGAWTRYGFHEDGLRSGLAVADALQAQWAAGDVSTLRVAA